MSVDLDAALAVSSIREIECPADAAAPEVTCSQASLPLHPSAPDPRQLVQVMVAFVDNGDPLDIGPVAFLQGGPGVGSITAAPRFVGAQYDVVFIDQRGTGFSRPKLDCPEVDALWVPLHTDVVEDRIESEEVELEAYATCRDRLVAEGIDLDAFNTSTAAADAAVLRRLLGYPSWNLWGISYGTRVGLAIMRDYPDGIRSAVLDSVVPFEADFFATIPENGLAALAALDAACGRAQCADDHGSVADNFASVVTQLDGQPAVVDVVRPDSGASFPFRVDGAQLVDLVFIQLYSTRELRSLPRQISRADFGGIDELVNAFVRRRDPENLDLSIALYYTTWCREEFPFHDLSADDAFLAATEARYGDAITEALSTEGVEDLCAIFDVSPAHPRANEPLEGDVEIPTLVFAGTFDPITPPAWSRSVVGQLGNARYVELTDHGHGMSTRCPGSIRVEFWADPAAELDLGCVAEIAGPDFD